MKVRSSVAAADARGVGRLVDAHVAGADLVGHAVVDRAGELADREAQPGVDLGGAGGVEHDVVDAPLGVDADEAALGRDEQDRDVDAGRAQQAGEAADLREVAAAVDEDRVALRRVEQRGGLRGEDAHLVRQQPEGGQHLGRRQQGVREEQERRHGGLPRVGSRTGSPPWKRGRTRRRHRPGPTGGRIANVDLRPSSRHPSGPCTDPNGHGADRRRRADLGRLRRPRGRRRRWCSSSPTGSPAAGAAPTTGGSPRCCASTAGSSPTTAAGTAPRPASRRSATTRSSTSTPRSAGPAGSARPRSSRSGSRWAARSSCARRPSRGATSRETPQAVVSVSAAGFWFYKGTPPMRLLHRAVETPGGRRVLRYGFHTRVTDREWEEPYPLSPSESAELVAPVPLLVVHGDQDPYFPVEHARSIVAGRGRRRRAARRAPTAPRSGSSPASATPSPRRRRPPTSSPASAPGPPPPSRCDRRAHDRLDRRRGPLLGGGEGRRRPGRGDLPRRAGPRRAPRRRPRAARRRTRGSPRSSRAAPTSWTR